jgi:hypothetical protein
MADLVVKTSTNKITTKEQLVNILKVQLSTNPNQAVKGLLRVFANQTADEQQTGGVRANNGIGFVHTDSVILTSFAKQYKNKGFLSEKQMAILYKKMPKYAKQLIEGSIAEGKIYKVGREYMFKKN